MYKSITVLAIRLLSTLNHREYLCRKTKTFVYYVDFIGTFPSHKKTLVGNSLLNVLKVIL